MTYLLTGIGLPPGGSSTLHIYTQNDTTQKIHRTTQNVLEECGPCPVFASYTLGFTLQLRKKHGKTSGARKNFMVYETIWFINFAVLVYSEIVAVCM